MVFHRICLILSPNPEPIIQAVAATGDKAVLPGQVRGKPDWIICYGHRQIIREPELTTYKDRIINLHISYLPWGRGADPNLWAWIDDEPHGVTLHYIDSGIDTGDIIAQRRVEMDADETLASSYTKLHEAAVGLFQDSWPELRNGRAARTPQRGPGSFHRKNDRDKVLLPKGWDTAVDEIRTVATQSQKALSNSSRR